METEITGAVKALLGRLTECAEEYRKILQIRREALQAAERRQAAPPEPICMGQEMDPPAPPPDPAAIVPKRRGRPPKQPKGGRPPVAPAPPTPSPEPPAVRKGHFKETARETYFRLRRNGTGIDDIARIIHCRSSALENYRIEYECQEGL